jgi:hypothetical protein
MADHVICTATHLSEFKPTVLFTGAPLQDPLLPLVPY